MRMRTDREIVIVDLIGELDVAMSARLDEEIENLACARAIVVVRFEGIESTQWAGLCEFANVIAKHRSAGIDLRVHSRLSRVRAVLEEFSIPSEVPDEYAFDARRRLIIARTPRPKPLVA